MTDFRVLLCGEAGSVAVNAFGVVTDVRIDRRNTEFMAENVLAHYLVTALREATRGARGVFS